MNWAEYSVSEGEEEEKRAPIPRDHSAEDNRPDYKKPPPPPRMKDKGRKGPRSEKGPKKSSQPCELKSRLDDGGVGAIAG
jgi:hypothetical protein